MEKLQIITDAQMDAVGHVPQHALVDAEINVLDYVQRHALVVV